jgi:hypothetical protein
VFRALNELTARLPLVHIAGTTLVACRMDLSAGDSGPALDSASLHP